MCKNVVLTSKSRYKKNDLTFQDCIFELSDSDIRDQHIRRDITSYS